MMLWMHYCRHFGIKCRFFLNKEFVHFNKWSLKLIMFLDDGSKRIDRHIERWIWQTVSESFDSNHCVIERVNACIGKLVQQSRFQFFFDCSRYIRIDIFNVYLDNCLPETRIGAVVSRFAERFKVQKKKTCFFSLFFFQSQNLQFHFRITVLIVQRMVKRMQFSIRLLKNQKFRKWFENYKYKKKKKKDIVIFFSFFFKTINN